MNMPYQAGGYASPFYQPNYGQLQMSYPQNINPPMPNTQMQQPAQRTYTPLAGRIVNEFNDIRPNEVPSDGSPAVFPLMDRSRIFVEEVAQNGLIETTEYVRVESESATSLDMVMRRLDKIENMLKPNYRPHYKKKGLKKEVTENAE